MQLIRGYMVFENKSIDDVKTAFAELDVDSSAIKGFVKSLLGTDNLRSLNAAFFKSIYTQGNWVDEPGIFISGLIDEQFSSDDVIRMFRNKIGLEGSMNSDISIQNEDIILSLKQGIVEGGYVGIRILPPYDIDQVCNAATEAGGVLNASDIFVRSVEQVEGQAAICMDIISRTKYEYYRKDIELLITSKLMKLGHYTVIEFE